MGLYVSLHIVDISIIVLNTNTIPSIYVGLQHSWKELSYPTCVPVFLFVVKVGLDFFVDLFKPVCELSHKIITFGMDFLSVNFYFL